MTTKIELTPEIIEEKINGHDFLRLEVMYIVVQRINRCLICKGRTEHFIKNISLKNAPKIDSDGNLRPEKHQIDNIS